VTRPRAMYHDEPGPLAGAGLCSPWALSIQGFPRPLYCCVMHVLNRLIPGQTSARGLAATVVLILVGCRSAEEFRAEADAQVYAILDDVRGEVGLSEPFTLDTDGGGLRLELQQGREVAEDLSPLTLLTLAAENSRDYRSNAEAVYLDALNLTLAQWNFSIQETGSLGALLSGTGSDATSAGTSGDLGFAKLFETGALVVGSLGIDLFRDISTGDGLDGMMDLSLAITQPLLRGFGRDIVREPLTQAEREVLYEVRSFERFRRTFAYAVADRFYRILQQVQTLENEERNRERLAMLRERNEAFSTAGRLSDIEVDQARQDEFAARDRVNQAQRSLEFLMDDFKLFLGLPVGITIVLERQELTTLESSSLGEVDVTEDLAVSGALERRLDHLTVLDRLADAERQVNVSADALRAGLDLNANLDLLSDEGQPLSVPGSGAIWSADLTLSLPLDRLPERNTYRASLINLDLAARATEASEDQITADIRDDLRQLDSARRSYTIQTGSVQLAERRVESAALNLEAGRADTRDLLEAQDDLVRARNAAVQSLIDTALARLALYRDMDLLQIDASGITLPPLQTQPLEEAHS